MYRDVSDVVGGKHSAVVGRDNVDVELDINWQYKNEWLICGS